MIATGKPGVAGAPERLRRLDVLARLHVDGAQVAVQGEDTEAVIENHGIAVNAQRTGVHHNAVLRRLDGAELQGGEVESEMRLMIDYLALIGVRTAIGERAKRRSIRLPVKRPVPQRFRRGVGRQLADARLVLLPQVAVDRQIALYEVATRRKAGIVLDLRHLARQEFVVDRESAFGEAAR